MNFLLSWLKTVNVAEQLSVDDSRSCFACVILSLKMTEESAFDFSPFMDVCSCNPQAFLCAFFMCQCDRLDLFCTCMRVARRSARSSEHVSSGHRTEAAHLADVCGSPALRECGVVADGKQLSFCICVCV